MPFFSFALAGAIFYMGNAQLTTETIQRIVLVPELVFVGFTAAASTLTDLMAGSVRKFQQSVEFTLAVVSVVTALLWSAGMYGGLISVTLSGSLPDDRGPVIFLVGNTIAILVGSAIIQLYLTGVGRRRKNGT